MLDVPDDVRAEVVVDDRHLSGRGRTTLLTLSWSRGDPLAVHLVLTATPEHPSLPSGRWVVLRDFLRYGLEEPTGDGRVRLRPDPLRDRIRLELARDCGSALVSAPRHTVREFLDATERLVPSGQEAGDDDLDALIARLLEET
jgi:Streptomyces sporulation and cell division protein, SsgA